MVVEVYSGRHGDRPVRYQDLQVALLDGCRIGTAKRAAQASGRSANGRN